MVTLEKNEYILIEVVLQLTIFWAASVSHDRKGFVLSGYTRVSCRVLR